MGKEGACVREVGPMSLKPLIAAMGDGPQTIGGSP
jgi:hypothetical protein